MRSAGLSKAGARGTKPDAAAGRAGTQPHPPAWGGIKLNIENRAAICKPHAIRGPDEVDGQNGFTITRTTMPIIRTVGTSFIRR